MSRPALLVLADGSVYPGVAVGVDGVAVGEVVFNTAMTGYQEILTDPSYAGQMVTLTCAHIGNTGANAADTESDRVHATGLIVRDVPPRCSSFRAEETLPQFLRRHDVVAIAEVDTRALTRRIRDGGAQAACVVAGSGAADEAAALAAARAVPSLSGRDLVRDVTAPARWQWDAGSWSLEGDTTPPRPRFHVVAMDFGVKRNILRLLVDRGCRLTVVPAATGAAEIRALRPDGLFLSNGPGDPEPLDYAIRTIAELVDAGMPTFGICLGHQLLALASGAATVKMKFGHHGANHPVLDLATGRVMISSQNHGFAVDPESLDERLAITHLSLFDRSLQGIRRLDVPAFSFQGHPEASPGPHDVRALFDDFIRAMEVHSSRAAPGAVVSQATAGEGV